MIKKYLCTIGLMTAFSFGVAAWDFPGLMFADSNGAMQTLSVERLEMRLVDGEIKATKPKAPSRFLSMVSVHSVL